MYDCSGGFVIHRLSTVSLHPRNTKQPNFPFQKKKLPQPFSVILFFFILFPKCTARDPPLPYTPGSTAAEWHRVSGSSFPAPRGVGEGLWLSATGTIWHPEAQGQLCRWRGWHLGSGTPCPRSCHQMPWPAQQSMPRFNPGGFYLPLWPQNPQYLHLKNTQVWKPRPVQSQPEGICKVLCFVSAAVFAPALFRWRSCSELLWRPLGAQLGLFRDMQEQKQRYVR